MIKAAYRTLMFKNRCHPDLGGNEEFARKINAAYETLSKPEMRLQYDLTLGPEFFKAVAEKTSERRRVPRVNVDFIVSYSSGDTRFEPARVLDLSALGCRIQTKDKLKENAQVTINIMGHTVRGAVRWKRMFHPTIFQRIHESGIEFMREFEDIEKIHV